MSLEQFSVFTYRSSVMLSDSARKMNGDLSSIGFRQLRACFLMEDAKPLSNEVAAILRNLFEYGAVRSVIL